MDSALVGVEVGAVKILRMDFFFLLPDDFLGDYNDALRELIKYREENKLPARPVDLDTKPVHSPDCSNAQILWDEFIKSCESQRFHGNVVFGSWNELSQQWEPINKS